MAEREEFAYRIAYRSSTGSIRILDACDQTNPHEHIVHMRAAGLDCWLERQPISRWERVDD